MTILKSFLTGVSVVFGAALLSLPATLPASAQLQPESAEFAPQRSQPDPNADPRWQPERMQGIPVGTGSPGRPVAPGGGMRPGGGGGMPPGGGGGMPPGGGGGAPGGGGDSTFYTGE